MLSAAIAKASSTQALFRTASKASNVEFNPSPYHKERRKAQFHFPGSTPIMKQIAIAITSTDCNAFKILIERVTTAHGALAGAGACNSLCGAS